MRPCTFGRERQLCRIHFAKGRVPEDGRSTTMSQAARSRLTYLPCILKNIF
jgi:hypothetical protein